MRLFLLLLSLFLPSLAQAAGMDEDLSDLTNMEGRYTLGAWSGAQAGSLCQLSNTETLSGGELTLLQSQRQPWLGLLLNTASISASSAQVHIDNAAFTLPLALTDNGMLMKFAAGDDIIAALNRAQWLTITIQEQSFRFDLHGINRALPLLKACREKILPADLPYDALAESEPQAIHGAAGWQMIQLLDGAYVYEQVATFAASPQQALSLWRYNADQWVLHISDPHAPTALQMPCLATVNTLKLACRVQGDGVMIPLDPANLTAVRAMDQVEVQLGGYHATFKTGALASVIAGF